MSTIVQNVVQQRVIRDGTGISSRIILSPVIATRLIRDGGAQGATGANGAIGGMTFTTVTTNLTMAVKTAYKVTNTVRVLLAMPSGAVGDEIYVYNYGVGGFRITVPSGSIIHILGNVNATATDGTGYIESVYQLDAVKLRCLATNEWVAEMYGCTTL